MPKARFTTVCECCKSPISVGSRYVVLHGRKWIPEHAQRYRHYRQSLTTK